MRISDWRSDVCSSVLREGDDAEASASGGFRLKPHAGVFKIISERARLDTGDAPTKRLDRSKSIYKVALGRRGSQEDLIREGLDSSLIHLGWGGDIDWSDERFHDFEEIRKKGVEEEDPGASGEAPNIEINHKPENAAGAQERVRPGRPH